jgi:hypothetical protein
MEHRQTQERAGSDVERTESRGVSLGIVGLDVGL